MKRLMVILSFLMLVSVVYAVPFSIDYSYVNTDTGPEYLNIQYGNYYDNVSLKLRLSANLSSGQTYVPVIVSPKVYGITNSGDLTYLYSVPSSTYYVYSNPVEYYYPNLFYLTSSYQGYVVQVYAQSGNTYSTYSSAYVYPVGYSGSYFYPVDNTTPQDPEPIETNCSSFFLSGQRDIYFEEDTQRNYNLYVENDSSQTLTLLSVTTSNPSRLNVRNIDYPDFVSGNYVGNITLRLEADTVSSDYDSSFDIYVRVRYGSDDECLKTYTVSYYVNDEDNDNTSSCSDISLKDTRFTINDNSTTRKTIIIENDSRDYDYEIDDITIEDKTNISSRIINQPTIIREESTGNLEIEFETDNLDYTTTRNLDLEIEGYLVRPGRDDKKCVKKQNLAITIKDTGSSGSTQNTQSCRDIVIYTTNILQAENTTNSYSRENGFFIVNNSNQQFNVSGLTINDNTNKGDVRNISYDSRIYAKSNSNYSFDFVTNTVNTTETSKGAISLTGTFADGKSCSASEIGIKQFDISVLDSSDSLCNNIGVYNKNITSGTNNDIMLFNNTNKKFYINDVLFQNRRGVTANITNKQVTLNPNSQNTMNVGFTGSGSLEMLVSGRFEDGKTCSFTQTRSGFLVTGSQDIYLSGDTCQTELIVPTTIAAHNFTEKMTISFKNSSSKAGKIIITGNGLSVEPGVIFLNGFDNFTKEITLSNFNNPTSVYFDVLVNDCSSQRTFTHVINTVFDKDRITLTTYPTMLSPKTQNVAISAVVDNSFSVSKPVTLRLTGLPAGFISYEKSTDIQAHSKKEIVLELSILENVSKENHNGYLELYSENKLLSKSPITIDLSPVVDSVTLSSTIENTDKIYTLKLNLKNNTSLVQETVIDFDLDSSYVIEGDKDIKLLPNETINKEFRIISSKLLREDHSFDIKIKDKTSGEILAREEITFKRNTSLMTGFLTLGNMGLVVLGLIVLIVLVILFKNK